MDAKCRFRLCSVVRFWFAFPAPPPSIFRMRDVRCCCGGWVEFRGFYDENPLLPLQLQSSSFFIINCIIYNSAGQCSARYAMPYHPRHPLLCNYFGCSIGWIHIHYVLWTQCIYFPPKYYKWIIIFRIFIKYFIYFLSLLFVFFFE